MSEYQLKFSKNESNKAKGIAIVLLVFHHLCFLESLFKNYGMTSLLPRSIVINIAVLARVCVPVFIFISSYGLTRIYKCGEISPIRFVCSRLLILMSARWFTYPIQLLAAYVLRERSFASIYNGNYRDAFFDFMGWGDFFGTPMVAGINWYIFLAQLIIIFIPIVCEIVRKFGVLSLLFAYFSMVYFKGGLVSSSGGDYSNYIFVSILGCLFAYNNIFERFKCKHKIFDFSMLILLFILVMWFKHIASHTLFDYRQLQFVGFGVAALIICIIVSLFSNCVLFKPLEMLGKYSGNIFYIHIFFIRSHIVVNRIHNVFLLLILSLSICFVLSYIIELLKKVSHFNELVHYCKKRIESFGEM